LNHILIIDRFYVDALEGGTLGPAAWVDPVPYPTVAELRPAQAAVDRRLIAWCEALDEASVDRIIHVHRGTCVQTELQTGFCCTCSSTRYIIGARRTECSAGLLCRRRNSTSSIRSQRRRCALLNLPNSDGARRQFGGNERAYCRCASLDRGQP